MWKVTYINFLIQIFPKPPQLRFDKIDNGKDGILPLSKFVDLIETRGEGFYSEKVTGHLRKLDPNESCSLERFAFVRWYVDDEVSMDSVEEAERFVGWR